LFIGNIFKTAHPYHQLTTADCRVSHAAMYHFVQGNAQPFIIQQVEFLKTPDCAFSGLSIRPGSYGIRKRWRTLHLSHCDGQMLALHIAYTLKAQIPPFRRHHTQNAGMCLALGQLVSQISPQ
jgi:hypothetical protein